MKQLKAFVTNQNWIDNTLQKDSPVGEISTWSLTYTRDRKEYGNDSLPHLRLHGIRYKETTTGEINFDSVVGDQVLEISQTVFDYAKTALTFDDTILENLLLNTYPNTQNYRIGPLISSMNATIPTWLIFEVKDSQDEWVECRVWYADEAFQTQFDEYEIVVVPPVEDIDLFFGGEASVFQLLQSYQLSEHTERLQTAKDGHPETYIRTLTFDYHSPTNPLTTFPTNWMVLIYGFAGDYIDRIKRTIIQYISENSQYSLDDWRVIFPDLFKTTSFYILPRWDLIAIPDMSFKDGLYGGIVRYTDALAYCSQQLPEYSGVIEEQISVLSYPYKNLSLCVVNGEMNEEGKERFDLYFKDYLAVPSTHIDFARMSQRTKDFILLLDDLIMSAESIDRYSSIPRDFRLIDEDGVYYLGTTFDDILLLVHCKFNLNGG